MVAAQGQVHPLADLDFAVDDGINLGPDQRQAAIANGLAEVERLAA